MKILIFIIYVCGLHTSYTYLINPTTPVPFTICALGWVLAVPVLFTRGRFTGLRNVWPVLVFLLLAIVINFVTARQDYYVKSFTGGVQLVYSLVIAAGLYYLILGIPRAALASVCLILLVSLGVFSVLERIPVFGAMSDAFRALLDTGGAAGGVYNSDLRDITLTGGIRSKVFSLEPSHVAITFFWLSMVLVWSSRGTALTIAIWLLSCAASIWGIRSPILLVAVLSGMLGFGITRRRFQAKLFSLEFRAVPILVTLALTGILLYVTSDLFSSRANEVIEGEGSFIMRVSGPWLFLTEFIPKFPFVGVGVVGDLDMLSDELLGMYRAMGLNWMGPEFVGKTISNCFGLHFVYFGGVGGVAMLWLILRASWIQDRLIWLIVLGQVGFLWMSMGGYNSPRIWCVSFALFAAARKHLQTDMEEESAINAMRLYQPTPLGLIRASWRQPPRREDSQRRL